MRVPDNFMSNDQKAKKAKLFIKKYIEHKPSKIYTKVEENLLVIVLRGKKNLVFQDFETSISEGEFAIFYKGNYIMNQIIDEGIYESLLIFMSDDFLKQVYQLSSSQNCSQIPFYKGKIVRQMQYEVDKIYELTRHSQYEDIIQLKIMELLIYIQNEDKTGNFKSFLHSFSDKEDFRYTICRTYMQYHNISEISDAMHMSLSTFKRKFRKEFGTSPHSWINERKLEKAIVLMDTSDYSITDIAFICGFSSLSTFMGQFKKKYGISPGKYRKL